jgi:hypothetical protein
VLVESSIEDDKLASKERKATLKKHANANKNKSIVPIKDPLSTKKSLRLSVEMKK